MGSDDEVIVCICGRKVSGEAALVCLLTAFML